MKNPKNQLIKDWQLIGSVGLPINNQPVYLSPSAFPNTTTLYGYRGGQAIQGGISLTKTGTISQALDHTGVISECEFNGAGYYTSTDAAFAFNGSFSLCFWLYRENWAKPEGSTVGNYHSYAYLSRVSGANGWYAMMNDGTTDLCFNTNNVTAIKTNVAHLSNKNWHFIQYTRDTTSGTQSYYIDGVRVGFYNSAGTITAGGPFNIGALTNGAYIVKECKISDIWIHNGTAWTDAQVKAIYAATCPQATYNQRLAGHRLQTVEAGQVASEVLAHYKFGTDLTIDEKGTYPLTAVGTPTQAEDIFGNMGAVRTSSGNSYYNASLLSTTPSKGWWVSLWVKPELYDALDQTIFSKVGTSGFNYMFELRKQAITGMYTVIYGNGTQYIKTLMTPFRIGRYDKFDVCWDSINGIRVFVNAVLELSDSSAISLPSLSTTYPLQIGRLFNGTAMNHFTGSICDLKVMDKIPTQKDIDMAYASTFLKPDGFKGADIVVRPSADSSRERREKIQCYVDNGTVYRQGMRQLYYDLSDNSLRENMFSFSTNAGVLTYASPANWIKNTSKASTGNYWAYFNDGVFSVIPSYSGVSNWVLEDNNQLSTKSFQWVTVNLSTLTDATSKFVFVKQGHDYLPEGFVACNSHDLIQIRGEK